MNGNENNKDEILKELNSRIETLEKKLEETNKEKGLIEKQAEQAERDKNALQKHAEKLTELINYLKQIIEKLKEQIIILRSPPNGYGIFLKANKDGSADIFANGAKYKVLPAEEIDINACKRGDEVIINLQSMTILGILPPQNTGKTASIKNLLDGKRAVIESSFGHEIVVEIADCIESQKIKIGDKVLFNETAGIILDVLPESEEIESLLLEEKPDVTYADIGGLGSQIEAIRDAVELPFLHRNLFKKYKLSAPKGIILYGPPGCGKTMVAKAIANQTNGHLFIINGPEILNKFVGASEEKIRMIFEHAKKKAAKSATKAPVIVFFDEIESILKRRGTGISTDIYDSIVPQFLSVIDGLEELKNVIVIGATNRIDLIDPGMLRPGRLDLKIKIDRPLTMEATQDIVSKYIPPNLPFDKTYFEEFKTNGDKPRAITDYFVKELTKKLWTTDETTRIFQIDLSDGNKQCVFFNDFLSGALIKGIIDRAKKNAIKRELKENNEGLKLEDFLFACEEEFKEHMDIPSYFDSEDDWSRIMARVHENTEQKIVAIKMMLKGTNCKMKKVNGNGGEDTERIDTSKYL